jgi:Fic family protein
MHIFDYSFLKNDLLPAQLVSLASNISTLKVMSAFRKKENETAFRKLEDAAKIESIRASNAIEGIVTTDQRVRAIAGGSAPLNHTEAEIAGYRDVLSEVHVNFAAHDFRESDIRAFHAQMMRLANPLTDGSYKTDDNVIAERMPDGRRVVRFQPASAAETPEAMRQLVLAYAEARDDAAINKLLLVPCVILDFLCVHPFADGNGRLSRLLTLLLLYRNGFDVGKYISFEGAVNGRKAEYYAALKESSEGWRDNQPRYFPFMVDFLTTLYSCYNELDKRFASTNAGKATKKSRIESTVLNSFTPLSKADICGILPDVSPTTVEAVLGEMVRGGRVRRIGAGRASRYVRRT